MLSEYVSHLFSIKASFPNEFTVNWFDKRSFIQILRFFFLLDLQIHSTCYYLYLLFSDTCRETSLVGLFLPNLANSQN